MMRIITTICSCAAFFSLVAAIPSVAEKTTFNLPLVKGKYVDHCLTWGAKCGQSAADNYCRRVGYERAQSFTRSEKGARLPTIVLGTNQACNKSYCVAFRTISCTRTTRPKPGSRKVFKLPRVNGKYVDNCLRWAANCGQAAADEFCKRAGYDHAKSYKRGVAGLYLPTEVLSTGQICNSKGCVALSRVECALKTQASTRLPLDAIARLEAADARRREAARRKQADAEAQLRQCKRRCKDKHTGPLGGFVFGSRGKHLDCVAECEYVDKQNRDALENEQTSQASAASPEGEVVDRWNSTNNCERECSEQCDTVFQRVWRLLALNSACERRD